MNYLCKVFKLIYVFGKKVMDFFCVLPMKKTLSKWDVVYVIVAVILSAAVMLIDPPSQHLHTASSFFKSSVREGFSWVLVHT